MMIFHHKGGQIVSISRRYLYVNISLFQLQWMVTRFWQSTEWWRRWHHFNGHWIHVLVCLCLLLYTTHVFRK